MHDHDARNRISHARLTNKDGKAGRLLRQLDGRLAQLERRLESLPNVQVAIPHPTSYGEPAIWPVLLHWPEHDLQLEKGHPLQIEELTLLSQDRIGICGPAASGKTALLRAIIESAELPKDKLAYLPQQVDPERSPELLEQLQALPDQQHQEALDALENLGADPHIWTINHPLSIQDIKALTLALQLIRNPALIVLDEPTEGMDLPSVEALERMLSNCRCALVLASHDLLLLRRLTGKRWELRNGQLEAGKWDAT